MTESRPIRLLVVDDHAVVREGVASLIALEADMMVIGEATNGAEGEEAFHRLRPDITLMDLQMPVKGGVEAIADIRAVASSARIIVLTTFEGDVQAMRALKAGASGYLLKSSLRRELIDTIRSVVCALTLPFRKISRATGAGCSRKSTGTSVPSPDRSATIIDTEPI